MPYGLPFDWSTVIASNNGGRVGLSRIGAGFKCRRFFCCFTLIVEVKTDQKSSLWMLLFSPFLIDYCLSIVSCRCLLSTFKNVGAEIFIFKRSRAKIFFLTWILLTKSIHKYIFGHFCKLAFHRDVLLS